MSDLERLAGLLLRVRWADGIAASEAQNGYAIVAPWMWEWGTSTATAFLTALRDPSPAMREKMSFADIEVWQATIDRILGGNPT